MNAWFVIAGRRLILVRGEYFNQLHLTDIRQFQDWCEQRILFRATSWVVSCQPGACRFACALVSRCPSPPAAYAVPREG